MTEFKDYYHRNENVCTIHQKLKVLFSDELPDANKPLKLLVLPKFSWCLVFPSTTIYEKPTLIVHVYFQIGRCAWVAGHLSTDIIAH